jgi:hypothetical protein
MEIEDSGESFISNCTNFDLTKNSCSFVLFSTHWQCFCLGWKFCQMVIFFLSKLAKFQHFMSFLVARFYPKLKQVATNIEGH